VAVSGCTGGHLTRNHTLVGQESPIFSHLRAVIFDFDFTLADSSVGVTECANSALVKLGFPTLPHERVRRTIGLSLPETFSALTGITDETLASSFATHFVQRADEVMESLTTLYDAVPQTIGLLRDMGVALGIVSTKTRYRIENILKQHGLADLFDVIVGGEDVAGPKPDPSGLLQALARLSVRPGEAVYVGDHVVDAEAALRAGIPFIGVLSGTCGREDFASYPVELFAGGVGELGVRFAAELHNQGTRC